MTSTSFECPSQFIFIEAGGSRAWVIASGVGASGPAVGVYTVPMP